MKKLLKQILRKTEIIFDKLCNRFTKVLFAFKIEMGDGAREQYRNILSSASDGIASNAKCKGRIVLMNKWEDFKIAVIFNKDSDNCYMDPQYQYTCTYCDSEPWTDITEDDFQDTWLKQSTNGNTNDNQNKSNTHFV